MQDFRQQVAISIDGGGIKGLIVAKALQILEEHLDQSLHDTFRLTAGTSTGAIIAAGIAAGLTGETMTSVYRELGPEIFRKSWRTRLWPLTRYRFPLEPLEAILNEHLGQHSRMGNFWSRGRQTDTDVVITTFDLAETRTRFIKPWKEEYGDWPVVTAVLASSSVPTYFPVVDGRYVDGGIGGYSNPCFLAAYEICNCLKWEPGKTTLISLGTGRARHQLPPAARLWPWQWLKPLLGAFLESADKHQVHLVTNFFENLDFRRFQVELSEPIEMDDARPETLDKLEEYGEKLGNKILNDEIDRAEVEFEPFRVV